jgi:hypothetical protein
MPAILSSCGSGPCPRSFLSVGAGHARDPLFLWERAMPAILSSCGSGPCPRSCLSAGAGHARDLFFMWERAMPAIWRLNPQRAPLRFAARQTAGAMPYWAMNQRVNELGVV